MKIIDTHSKKISGEENQVLVLKTYITRSFMRKCNLCEEAFHPHSKFDRFCELCKVESELYHFAEWLSA